MSLLQQFVRVVLAFSLAVRQSATSRSVLDKGPVNLSLHQNSYQSSTYIHEGIPVGPEKAVDGNKDGDFEHGSCTHTEEDFQAWWMVDLGDAYYISSVEISSRALFPEDPHRLVDFKIESALFRSKTGSLIQPTLCYYQPNQHSIVHGITKNYTCCSPVMARFVRIQLQGTNHLTLCEVGVFGTTFERQVYVMEQPHLKSKADVLDVYTSTSVLKCLHNCLHSSACSSTNVKLSTTKSIVCENLYYKSNDISESILDSCNWAHFTFF